MPTVVHSESDDIQQRRKLADEQWDLVEPTFSPTDPPAKQATPREPQSSADRFQPTAPAEFPVVESEVESEVEESVIFRGTEQSELAPILSDKPTPIKPAPPIVPDMVDVPEVIDIPTLPGAFNGMKVMENGREIQPDNSGVLHLDEDLSAPVREPGGGMRIMETPETLTPFAPPPAPDLPDEEEMDIEMDTLRELPPDEMPDVLPTITPQRLPANALPLELPEGVSIRKATSPVSAQELASGVEMKKIDAVKIHVAQTPESHASNVPAIRLVSYHHPLNEVRQDINVRPAAMQEDLFLPPANDAAGDDAADASPPRAMDAMSLAEAAAEAEQTARDARKRNFADVSPPAKRHNVYPRDEYIIDTNQPARIKEIKPRDNASGEEENDDWRVSAQDNDGTMIFFSTPGGRSTLQTPEPVYVYSPRFRAVRQVVDPTLNAQIVKVGNVDTPTAINTQARTVGPERTTQNNQAITETGRTQLVKLDGTRFGAEISAGQQTGTAVQDATLPQESLALTVPSMFDMSDSPRTGEGIQGAVTWASTEQMFVFIDHQRAAASISTQNSPSLYTVDEKQESPRVKIYKVADTDASRSGETVTFTIRFENAGNTSIGNVVVVDNLPARLALDPNSSESSLDVQFSYEPNANGSSLLRWEVNEPLQPGEWGVVRFQCLVR